MPITIIGNKEDDGVSYEIFVCKTCEVYDWRQFPGGQFEMKYMIGMHQPDHEMQHLYTESLVPYKEIFPAENGG